MALTMLGARASSGRKHSPRKCQVQRSASRIGPEIRLACRLRLASIEGAGWHQVLLVRGERLARRQCKVGKRSRLSFAGHDLGLRFMKGEKW
jgi:hypothetical protein